MPCFKRRHLTKRDAVATMNYTNKHGRVKKLMKRVYWCKPCKAWHLTTKDKL